MYIPIFLAVISVSCALTDPSIFKREEEQTDDCVVDGVVYTNGASATVDGAMCTCSNARVTCVNPDTGDVMFRSASTVNYLTTYILAMSVLFSTLSCCLLRLTAVIGA